MRLKVPGFRLRLRTLAALVAVLAVSLWAGLSIWSPTRRLGRLLMADQPVFVRREAAASLGREIPPWEVDQAVSLLIRALDDPSPRVREYAGVGLAELGPRAQRAIPKLIAVLGDEDRFVRFAAAGTLGLVVAVGSERRGEAVAALARTLDDKDPDVRLSAAGALVKMGEARRAAGVLLAAYGGMAPHLLQLVAADHARRERLEPLRRHARPGDTRQGWPAARRGAPDLAADRLSRSGEIDPQFRPRRR
jgi:HEAT repeat protein